LKQDQLLKLDAWLRSILWDTKLPGLESASSSKTKKERQNFEIYRLKAKIPLDDGTVKIVQGVREVFEICDAPGTARADGIGSPLDGQGKLVFIGRNIAGLPLEASYFSMVNTWEYN
jgi:hypothetical protein